MLTRVLVLKTNASPALAGDCSNSTPGRIRRAVLRRRSSSYGRGFRQSARHAHGAHPAVNAGGGQQASSCLPLLGKKGGK